MNITAKASITVQGNIITSGRGPMTGPGTKTSSTTQAYGGTYGGSGGKSKCSDGYFTNFNSQVSNILQAFDNMRLSQYLNLL